MDSESFNVEETACPICRKTFKSQTSLNGHLQCHNFKSGQFRFPCDYSCGESFDNLAQLWKHKRFHEQKNRPYVCDLCSRAFERYLFFSLFFKIHSKNIAPFYPDEVN